MKFYEQHKDRIREIIRYVIVGVATTAVSIGVYWLCNRIFTFRYGYAVSNAVSWIAAVTFPFFANRKIVFRSDGDVKKEIVVFFLSRLFSLGVEYLVLFVSVEALHVDETLSKIIAQFIVFVLNFILGKFLVFRKKKAPTEDVPRDE